MKKTVIPAVILLFAFTARAQTAIIASPAVLKPAAGCDESLWDHVYVWGLPNQFRTAKDRLKIIDACKTVTGTIINMVPKPDGDYHIQVKLDPGQRDLLNARNRSKHLGQHGYFVIEPICQKAPIQKSAKRGGPCRGFRQNLQALATVRANLKKKKGTHVEITGAFITDAEHGWNEIHPITSIVVK